MSSGGGNLYILRLTLTQGNDKILSNISNSVRAKISSRTHCFTESCRLVQDSMANSVNSFRKLQAEDF